STFPVILNKYLNTLKIFGIKVKKVKNKYYLLNMPFNIDFTANDVKAVQLLKSACEMIPNAKSKEILLTFIKAVEMRYNETAKSVVTSFNIDMHPDLTFYFSKFHDQILECEKLCSEKKKLEILYLTEDKESTIICSPKEVKYQNRKVCFSVFNQLSRQVFDIPIDNIKSIKQLPTLSSTQNVSMSVVYKLKGRLAEAYKLKEWEYSNGYDSNGNLIVVNSNEDPDVLLSRLMKYGENCILVTPKFMKDRMRELIDKVLDNYNK
uniref:hypothetical protein n=1 Tax=Candidatus Scatousia sp. TaxID=3085663 RepID=UPI00402949FB